MTGRGNRGKKRNPPLNTRRANKNARLVRFLFTIHHHQ
ncbi:hypothetical protein COLO4_16047 [Corchorus olitorius]|uniref:Uncharacterized protein n=1 Tax=Corchorus olitorius TaxID=93759 RepID=A0A1R3JK60_9ROSI|nr:hypothetical protein COLO4_16047 [Corchorus olitorius]